MSESRMDGTQVTLKAKTYSTAYSSIRKAAESSWPAWKKETFNISFATSAHARKVTQK